MNQQNLFCQDGYCIDANCIIEMWRRHYSFKTFPSLKSEIEQMMQIGKLIAPKEVIAELMAKDDDLAKWAKGNGFETPSDARQIAIAAEVVNAYPRLMDIRKPHCADPFLIALAEVKGWTVITQEDLSSGRPKIPNVCRDRGVRCIKLLQFIDEQGWRF